MKMCGYNSHKVYKTRTSLPFIRAPGEASPLEGLTPRLFVI